MGSKIGANKGHATKVGVPFDEWQARRESGQNWCYCCREWHTITNFGIDKSRSNKLSSTCKQCSALKGVACRYRVTVDEARRLRAVDRVCAICGRDKNLEIAHDHDTGAVRGVLCGRCNKGLGLFLDNAVMLRKAITYLEGGSGD